MRARYGEQSKNRVIQRWHRASSSHPDNPPYEIQLHDDGILTCNCRGWVNRASRDCRHVKDLVHEAQRILDAMGLGERTVRGERTVPRPAAISEERAFPAGRKIAKEKEKAGRYIEIGGDWA